jgi:hypothetical protein
VALKKIPPTLRSKTIFTPNPHIYKYITINVGFSIGHILILNLKKYKMKQMKVLLMANKTLSLMMEDLATLLESMDNNDLIMDLEDNVISHLENAQTQLDMIVDDIDNGMYENTPDEDFEEWN